MLIFDMSTYGIIAAFFYVMGIICSILALWRSRTPQGASAWVVGLISFPFISVPLFLIFGRNKFQGYVEERKEFDQSAKQEIEEISKIFSEEITPPKNLELLAKVVNPNSQPAFLGHNQIALLVNGEETYESMLSEIENAKKYILLQVYIFRTDAIGKRFTDLLIKKSRQGVAVYFLCDKVGTRLKNTFVKELEKAGIAINLFTSWKNWDSYLQINFRNHRKLLVVDGKTAFVGGHNIGDDYLDRWRDTHVKITGPSALAAQLSFLKDWHWAKDIILDLDWDISRVEVGDPLMVLHSGPADDKETTLLAHLSLIKTAKKRIWLASPYFIPSEGLSNALNLAALQGIEVKILIPSYTDNLLVSYASEVYVEKLCQTGVKFYKYLPGFLHQKVILIDDEVAAVGSANLDPRSLFINFEITAFSSSEKFIREMEAMLNSDFINSKEITKQDLAQRTFGRKLLSRAANLVAPML